MVKRFRAASANSFAPPPTPGAPVAPAVAHEPSGEGVRIEGTAYLRDVEIGDGCHLKLGVRAEECHIGPHCEIGPFANLRTGTELAGHNRIGNFVETKKARIGRGTKASHLSYLGDATIGAELLSRRGLVIAEHEKRFDPGEAFGELRRYRKLTQGDTALSFYRR